MHFGHECYRSDAASFSVHLGGPGNFICPIKSDTNFDHLAKVVAGWFLHCKVAVFPVAFDKYLWKDVLRLYK